MRKALIGLIVGATMLTPAAAMAQREHRDHDGGGHSERHQNQNGGSNNRAERIQQRVEQRQEQSQPQVQVQQQQQQPQVQQQVRVVQRQRGGENDSAGGNWHGGNRGGDRGDRGGRGDRRSGGTPGSIYPQAWQGNPNDPMLRHYQEAERRNLQRGNRNDDRRGDWRNDRRGGDRGDWRNDRRDDHRRTNWNRGWRNDRRYDWGNWRHRNRTIFHLSPYYSPYRNYRYSRFSIGIFLDSLFYDQRYWIGDPWQYRLPPAPYGTQWVRYYDDVLLVDVYTGEVLDVIYDFFW